MCYLTNILPKITIPSDKLLIRNVTIAPPLRQIDFSSMIMDEKMYVNYTDFDIDRLVLIPEESETSSLICYNYKPSKNPIIKLLRIKGPMLNSLRGVEVNRNGLPSISTTIENKEFISFWEKLHSSLVNLTKEHNTIIKYPIDIVKDDSGEIKSINKVFDIKLASKLSRFYYDMVVMYIPDLLDEYTPIWDYLKDVTMSFTPYISFQNLDFSNGKGEIEFHIESAIVKSVIRNS